MSPRDEAVQQAGALEMRVSDIFDRNAELEALADSLQAAYDAVSSENGALRQALDLRTRQRDAVVRERDVFRQALTKVGMATAEALRASAPQPKPQPANVSVLKNAPLMR